MSRKKWKKSPNTPVAMVTTVREVAVQRPWGVSVEQAIYSSDWGCRGGCAFNAIYNKPDDTTLADFVVGVCHPPADTFSWKWAAVVQCPEDKSLFWIGADDSLADSIESYLQYFSPEKVGVVAAS